MVPKPTGERTEAKQEAGGGKEPNGHVQHAAQHAHHHEPATLSFERARGPPSARFAQHGASDQLRVGQIYTRTSADESRS